MMLMRVRRKERRKGRGEGEEIREEGRTTRRGSNGKRMAGGERKGQAQRRILC